MQDRVYDIARGTEARQPSVINTLGEVHQPIYTMIKIPTLGKLTAFRCQPSWASSTGRAGRCQCSEEGVASVARRALPVKRAGHCQCSEQGVASAARQGVASKAGNARSI